METMQNTPTEQIISTETEGIFQKRSDSGNQLPKGNASQIHARHGGMGGQAL